MGFLSSLQPSNPFSICTDTHSVSVYPAIKWHRFSASILTNNSVPAKKNFLDLQLTNFNKKWPVIQCHGKEENTVPPIFGEGRFSSLTALALGILCPCDALAETCSDSNGQIFNMPLFFGIALIGAAVGGLLARQRRFELERMNNQLRQINTALKRQARIESYAPSLTYAPVGRSPDTETIIDTRRDEMMAKLKVGKKYLRLQSPQKAFEEFKAALEIAQSLGDPVEAKKAARGLGASCQRQRKYREAVKYHSMVLSISDREKEHSGDTEAYGAIADCYTELGDLETAAKYYDKYIERLETD